MTEGKLTPKEIDKIVFSTLKNHYRLTMESKRVQSGYLLMFTEGGESHAVAHAIADAQYQKIIDRLVETSRIGPKI